MVMVKAALAAIKKAVLFILFLFFVLHPPCGGLPDGG
jgi:hypothetical protein